MPQSDNSPVLVEHINVNGSHFFVAPDGCEKTAGLCVGSRNLREAFEQVGPALQFLLKANHGLSVSCKPKLSYTEYLRQYLESIQQDLAQGVVDVRSDYATLHDLGGGTKLWEAKIAGHCTAN